MHVEVQWTSELTIAAIERNGGTITTKFYDPQSVLAMSDPLAFFKKGVPIPRVKLPPLNAIDYYSSAKNRGYLADPEEIQTERHILAQKYGYELPDLRQDPLFDMLCKRKDPRQIWFGLSPGWVVNLKDRTILKPTDPDLAAYYQD